MRRVLLITLAVNVASMVFLISLYAGDNRSKEITALSDFYEQVPDIPNCNHGILKESEKQKIIEEINFLRGLHHLDSVSYKPAGDEQTAMAALGCVANKALSHQPPSSWKCYNNDMKEGCAGSNLFLGAAYSEDVLPESISSLRSWMQDSGSVWVGHRRAIINPFVSGYSFGRVDGKPEGTNFYYYGMALKYDDYTQNSINTDIEYVAYPYEKYPPEYFNNNWYLSFSVVADKNNLWANANVDFSQASVTMKDENDNGVNITEIIHDNTAWGSFPNCLKWKVGENLQEEVKYYVEITGVSVKGKTKEYSYWFKLTDQLIDPPPAPELVSPADNSRDVDTNVTLRWNRIPSATGYTVQVEVDSVLREIMFESNRQDTSVELTGLKPCQNYYWRVVTGNEGGRSEWSEYRKFTVKTILPEAAALSAPADKEDDVSIMPDFEWQVVGAAESYTLEISENPEFSGTSVRKYENIDFSEFTLPEDDKLEGVTKYYWRVRGVNFCGEGNWSEDRWFMTFDPSSVADMSADIEGLRCYPNPVSDEAVIEFHSQKPGKLNMSLIDITGKEVKTIFNGYIESGNQIKTFNKTGLTQGVYLLKLKFDANVKIIEIAIIK